VLQRRGPCGGLHSGSFVTLLTRATPNAVWVGIPYTSMFASDRILVGRASVLQPQRKFGTCGGAVTRSLLVP
jgi:hypothetical protein